QGSSSISCYFADEGRAVRQVAERAENRVAEVLLITGQHFTRCQSAGASIDNGRGRAAVYSHAAEGGSCKRFGSLTVRHALVGREGVEGQRIIDGKGSEAAHAVSAYGRIPELCARVGAGGSLRAGALPHCERSLGVRSAREAEVHQLVRVLVGRHAVDV